MPIYEFICEECDFEFEELLRSAADIQTVTCPACLGEKVVKKISAFAAASPGGKATSFWGGSSAPSCSSGSV
jgi:putative FmdB family regulatory protein